MFIIKDDKSIHLTRGDIANIVVTANLQDGSPYTFLPGDTVSFRVIKKGDHNSVEIQKDVAVDEENTAVTVYLDKEDTKLGEIINKPIDYWYEVELNHDTQPQTIVGYDEDGPKIFRLYPEGNDDA